MSETKRDDRTAFHSLLCTTTYDPVTDTFTLKDGVVITVEECNNPRL